MRKKRVIKKILLISGIHGDDRSGPIGLMSYFSDPSHWDMWQAKATIDIMPLINPTGFERNSRSVHGTIDMNRYFHDDIRKGDPKECTTLKKVFQKIKNPYDYLISFHEDVEAKALYLYDDSASGRDSKLIQALLRVAIQSRTPLFSGPDDPEISNGKIVRGYFAVSKSNTIPALENYLVRNKKVKQAVTVEIPGLLSLPKRINLVKNMLHAIVKVV